MGLPLLSAKRPIRKGQNLKPTNTHAIFAQTTEPRQNATRQTKSYKCNVKALSRYYTCREKRILKLRVWPRLASMQSAYTVLYCHRWPVWLYHIFPHYLINGTIFGEKRIILLLPLALQPSVGFGLSNTLLPFFSTCRQLSPSPHS